MRNWLHRIRREASARELERQGLSLAADAVRYSRVELPTWLRQPRYRIRWDSVVFYLASSLVVYTVTRLVGTHPLTTVVLMVWALVVTFSLVAPRRSS